MTTNARLAKCITDVPVVHLLAPPPSFSSMLGSTYHAVIYRCSFRVWSSPNNDASAMRVQGEPLHRMLVMVTFLEIVPVYR